MAQDAIIVLERLRCLRELDLPGATGSEPYIWPVMVRIDDLTLQTQALVDVISPLIGNARVLIKNDMRAQQSADIPVSVGVLRTRLEDSLFDTRLLLVIALWDEDETPADAVRAGFQAFVSALGAALGDATTLIALKDAEDRNDEQAKQAIIKTIQEQVEKAVKSAISNSLTGPQKVAVKAGFLNLDDAIGSAFRGFSNSLPTSFTLGIGKGTANNFEIQGRLEIREVRRDNCQAQVDAVRNAQTGVDDVNNQIKELQEALNDASPSDKPFLLSEIRRLREEDLVIAQDALGKALTALSICRSRIPPTFPTDAQQVTGSVTVA